MEEIWRPITNYEGLYEVSSLGNFRKILANGGTKSLKTTKNNWGYYTIGLWKDHKVKQFRISRIIAEVFIPNPDNKPYVDHIDTNKNNNRASNLRWVTPKENSNNSISVQKMLASWQNEERRQHLSNINLGANHPRALAVDMLNEQEEVLQTFSTAAEAARSISCKPQNITKCCKGERKTTGGFKWRYHL